MKYLNNLRGLLSHVAHRHGTESELSRNLAQSSFRAQFGVPISMLSGAPSCVRVQLGVPNRVFSGAPRCVRAQLDIPIRVYRGASRCVTAQIGVPNRVFSGAPRCVRASNRRSGPCVQWSPRCASVLLCMSIRMSNSTPLFLVMYWLWHVLRDALKGGGEVGTKSVLQLQ